MPVVRDGRFKFARGARSYDGLLKYKCVKEWADCYVGNTRDVYLYRLEGFLCFVKLDPKKLLGLKCDRVKRLLVGYCNRLRGEGRDSIAWNTVKAVKSYMLHHDRPLVLKRHEKVRVHRKRVLYEHVPSKVEVYAMADVAGNPRDRSLILCLWQSGVRVNCLCRWTIGMVSPYLYPEIRYPIPLKITGEMDSKLNGYSVDYYYTFLHHDACEALRGYLDWRKKNQHKTDFKGALFVSNAVKPLKPNVIREVVKRVALKAGLDPGTVWPHLFRKAFRKTLNAADMDDDTREALMGHRLPGSRENYFDRHDVEDVKQKYMSAGFTRQPPVIEGADMAKMRQLEDEVKGLREELIRQKAFEEYVRKKLNPKN